MISHTRRALLSLVFTPWVSAAPAMQRSELLLVESLPASCNFDLSTIKHELCTIVHDLVEIVDDEAALNTPYIIDLSEYSSRWSEKAERFTASAAHLQTISDIPIAAQSSNHDSGARRPAIEHNTRPREHVMNRIISSINKLAANFATVNFPEIQISTNGGPVLISFVFMPDRHMDKLDSVRCTCRLTWESLNGCDREPLESLKIVLPDNDRPEGRNLMEELLRGQVQWERHGDSDTNSDIFENRGSETNNRPRDGHNVDIRGDEENVNEDNDEKPDDRPEENPTDEQDDKQESIPPTNRNSWSLTIILLMTSYVLIIATRRYYPRLRGLLRSYQKPNCFRVGETVLLRWAREDMDFDDEEEDTMVNGSDSLIRGEEIPLKPSPRNNFVLQYGTAQ
ncbi:uncharacterized protein F5891DRAFT_1042205 [Suillus fuscotomentosus]|uniref:Uncharacterized protein n=1 Tax=Suillus fuscotomentosus TaxID=1912939 RepID=A0AAD4E398_9AGAM|nr:uncharacterized protein F5891DRAFT_1042205 [Suillus fuscotomentosus]KAG1898745.1 hypothetical protein F5891DRAFT_1042205 [Suillus fuscotomentosus]